MIAFISGGWETFRFQKYFDCKVNETGHELWEQNQIKNDSSFLYSTIGIRAFAINWDGEEWKMRFSVCMWRWSGLWFWMC